MRISDWSSDVCSSDLIVADDEVIDLDGRDHAARHPCRPPDLGYDIPGFQRSRAPAAKDAQTAEGGGIEVDPGFEPGDRDVDEVLGTRLQGREVEQRADPARPPPAPGLGPRLAAMR